jgi:hypothetical protein
MERKQQEKQNEKNTGGAKESITNLTCSQLSIHPMKRKQQENKMKKHRWCKGKYNPHLAYQQTCLSPTR